MTDQPFTTAHRPDRLTHDAFFYTSDDQFTAALTPFIREGLANDDAVIAAVTRPNIGLLQAALGDDAERVQFIDRDGWYRRPAVTIAGWLRLLAEAKDKGHNFVRMIGEVAFAGPERHTTWTRYESALNELLAATSSWIVCPYDTRTLAPQVLADAHRTHRGIFDVTRRPSDAYLPTRDLFAQLPETLPAGTGVPDLDLRLDDLTSIAVARQAAAEIATRRGVMRKQAQELQLVVSELAANTIRHGGGERRFKLWISTEAIIGEVTDEGAGISDLLAGYQAPPSDSLGGWGLWLTQQLCDQIAVARDNTTTSVRFRIALEP